MKTVVNKTHRPLKIQLRGGKTLHLGPQKSGQISDRAVEEDSIRKLLDAGDVEIAGETGQAPEAESGGAAHEATHGHPQETVVHRKGNR